MWLGGSRARIYQRKERCTFWGSGPSALIRSCHSFLLILRNWACGAFHCSTLSFSHSPLHLQACIDRGEPPGIAVLTPAPPSTTEMHAGRRRLTACLLQRRATCYPLWDDRSNVKWLGCCTIALLVNIFGVQRSLSSASHIAAEV